MTAAEKLRILRVQVQEIKQDCECLSLMDGNVMSLGEKRAWKAVASKLNGALKDTK